MGNNQTHSKKTILKLAGAKMAMVFLLCLFSAVPLTIEPVLSQSEKFFLTPFYIQLVLTMPFLVLFIGGMYIFLVSKEGRTDLFGIKLMSCPVVITKVNFVLFLALFLGVMLVELFV